MSLIYILCTPSEYTLAKEKGAYHTESLESEGFIHASPAEQLTRVANKHYVQHPELLVLGIDPEKVASEIRWEKASTGGEYPHIYGPLNLDAVTLEENVTRMPDGNYEIYVTD